MREDLPDDRRIVQGGDQAKPAPTMVEKGEVLPLAEADAALDVLMEGIQLGVEPPPRPAQKLGHAATDADRAVQAPAAALADARASHEHVLQ